MPRKPKGPPDVPLAPVHTRAAADSQARAPSRVACHAIDLHVHDLRHEGGSRLLEAGWLVHYVQHMLGHASLQQTSTYLNATLRGLHESMRTRDEARKSCKSVASEPSRGQRPARKQVPASNVKSLIR